VGGALPRFNVPVNVMAVLCEHGMLLASAKATPGTAVITRWFSPMDNCGVLRLRPAGRDQN
jgi:hypothetical protein